MDERTTAYLRSLVEEDEPLRAARARSEEADIPAIPQETGALLRFLARVTRARTAVEVGSGGGYSGLWLLSGLEPRGALTTIELDPGHQSLAQRAFAEAGAGDRVRTILGAGAQVLPRLADGAYDIVFLDAVKAEYPEYLVHARRLLRDGGMLIADNVLWKGKVADPAVTDESTEGLRAFTQAVYEDPAFTPALLPTGDGVLAAVFHRA